MGTWGYAPIGAQKAQEVYLVEGKIMKNGTTIDFTKAITSGIIDFEQACALQGATMTQAIQEGILTFEEACQLQGIAIEVSNQKPKAAPAPKAPKAKKPAKAPKAKAPKAEETKAEVAKEPVYTHGGCILQWGDDIAAKGKEKAAITKAYNSLVKQGCEGTKKRVGSYVYLYHAKDAEKSTKGHPVYLDGKNSKDFAAASLDTAWVMIKGGWAYPDLLKDYDDNFRK